MKLYDKNYPTEEGICWIAEVLGGGGDYQNLTIVLPDEEEGYYKEYKAKLVWDSALACWHLVHHPSVDAPHQQHLWDWIDANGSYLASLAEFKDKDTLLMQYDYIGHWISRVVQHQREIEVEAELRAKQKAARRKKKV